MVLVSGEAVGAGTACKGTSEWPAASGPVLLLGPTTLDETGLEENIAGARPAPAQNGKAGCCAGPWLRLPASMIVRRCSRARPSTRSAIALRGGPHIVGNVCCPPKPTGVERAKDSRVEGRPRRNILTRNGYGNIGAIDDADDDDDGDSSEIDDDDGLLVR